jgi:hypothetical protein
MKGLERYSWAGHSAILGNVKREWQEVEEILSYFGNGKVSMGSNRGKIEENKGRSVRNGEIKLTTA